MAKASFSFTFMPHTGSIAIFSPPALVNIPLRGITSSITLSFLFLNVNISFQKDPPKQEFEVSDVLIDRVFIIIYNIYP